MGEYIKPLMASASYSRLEYYHNCPAAFKFKYIDKVKPLPSPEQRDRQGNIKPAAYVRGSKIHQSMDDYINHRADALIPELWSLRFEIEEARRLKQEHPERVLTEQNKFFDTNYKPIDMSQLKPEEMSTTSAGDPCPIHYHVLIIIDLLIFSEDFKSAKVIDLKSGKIHQADHQQQTQLYALFTSIEYPDVEELTTQLWYCDQDGLVTEKTYDKFTIGRYFGYWDSRLKSMWNDNTWRTQEHPRACMFCAYGANGKGELKEDHSNVWTQKLGLCDKSMDKRYRK